MSDIEIDEELQILQARIEEVRWKKEEARKVAEEERRRVEEARRWAEKEERGVEEMRKAEERKKAEEERRQTAAAAATRVREGVDKGEGPSGTQEEAAGVKRRKDGYVIFSFKKAPELI